MKPKHLLTSTALALAAIVGTARADLLAELAAGQPTAESLAQTAETLGVSVETLIGDLAAQFKDQPALLQAIIREAIKAFPEQASQIVYVAVTEAPAQKAAITKAAEAQLGNTAEAQTIARNETGSQPQGAAEPEPEAEAEQTEAPSESQGNLPANESPAPTPPPPPPPLNNTPNDRPPAISTN
ncbi:hypothetical protein [Endozoicomonas acroporae]|uniref:hypothetical protein n=1 Tax=Endozoicomonas acroporae TaxID=1701104 RepID=UPI0013D0E7A1|nr:hypothetical protein [Endozoicomonas acroporae]